jgi:glycosyltransferase involved in cell wall biosynthesis
VNFTGWVTPDQRDALLQSADLLVVPSVLPESLGLVGLEAGRLGVPAAAFDIGGVGQWLIDGKTGMLAAADPPTAHGLAHAVTKCLDGETLVHLARQAAAHAASVSPAAHARELAGLLQRLHPRDPAGATA